MVNLISRVSNYIGNSLIGIEGFVDEYKNVLALPAPHQVLLPEVNVPQASNFAKLCSRAKDEQVSYKIKYRIEKKQILDDGMIPIIANRVLKIGCFYNWISEFQIRYHAITRKTVRIYYFADLVPDLAGRVAKYFRDQGLNKQADELSRRAKAERSSTPLREFHQLLEICTISQDKDADAPQQVQSNANQSPSNSLSSSVLTDDLEFNRYTDSEILVRAIHLAMTPLPQQSSLTTPPTLRERPFAECERPAKKSKTESPPTTPGLLALMPSDMQEALQAPWDDLIEDPLEQYYHNGAKSLSEIFEPTFPFD
jgi:hypothetical protein